MDIINSKILKHFDEKAFINRDPFPFESIQSLIKEEYYETLCDTFPDIKYFEHRDHWKRNDNQKSHEKYLLIYDDFIGNTDNSVIKKGISLGVIWNRLINDLLSDEYKKFVARAVNWDINDIDISIEWQMLPTGAEQPPHLDGYVKLFPHIFYFNKDWSDEWGGETVILGFKDKSMHKGDIPIMYDEFDVEHKATCKGNVSTVAMMGDRSWHGVRPIKNPEGTYRKTMLVVAISKKRTKYIYRKIKLNSFLSKLFPAPLFKFIKKHTIHKKFRELN
jgi:hypothetical protein